MKNEFFIHATEGCYAVFFPNDAHRPGVCVDGKPLDYRKVVVKVSVDLL
ncbi:MAG: YhcH/YjgK/YiaL family protein [Christensenellales bacterium]